MKELTGAVVLAAGSGSRMKSSVRKQYMPVNGKPLAYYCLKALSEKVDRIVLVCGAGEEEYCRKEIIKKYDIPGVIAVVPGGKERYHSVYEGLKALEGCSYVLIQDGARPCLTEAVIDACICGAKEKKACVAAVPSKDTIKQVSPGGEITRTPDRRSMWIVQTPQAFAYDLVLDSYTKMMKEPGDKGVTDDGMVVEQWGHEKVWVVQGDYRNMKVTTPEDVAVAELFLKMIESEKA